MSEQIIECVPNFSEGQDEKVIEKIKNAIASTPGVKLLLSDSGYDAHRTVYTFAGAPDSVLEAAFNSIKMAASLIDMSHHKGLHPRSGTCDVCPIIPVRGVSMEQAIQMSKKLGVRVWNELKIPVYYYENSATTPARKNLAYIRKGGYENLATRLRDDIDFRPDEGEPIFNSQSGICTIGARDYMVAYNINLASRDTQIASLIAKTIRESGNYGVKGKFKKLKAMGWYMPTYEKVQVSMNFYDCNITPIHTVYEEVKKLAWEYRTFVTGSELVGLIPYHCVYDAGKFASEYDPKLTDEQIIKKGIRYLNLDEVKPFDPQIHILEYALGLK
ncbi:MAG: glutamate formimidoyltransferase [Cytophagales bacterium]|nr:glutamate formimidoyltransferase [Cytophagales bacterium]